LTILVRPGLARRATDRIAELRGDVERY